MIDLNRLYNRDVERLDISGEYVLPEEYITDTRIKSIDKINVEGNIKLILEENEESIYIDASIKTNVTLEDSISLKPINYEINIKYDDYLDENYKNNENKLDIFAFLWENIELEIPIRYTREEDLTKFSGNNWKLISEDELDK
ncbi:MAG: hypothetical protein IJI43_01505 [Bacilli bacterium]|nr:hypothetical protein [Bacilli bacterium]